MAFDSVENQNKTEDLVLPPVEEPVEEPVDEPMDYTLKHPLQNSWTLWYFDNDRTLSWVDNNKEIASFQTVEDFWSLYNHIKPASDLRQGNDYSLFKKGVKPMWEDPANKKGGRWLINLDRKQRSAELDRYWLDVLLCLVGEAFDNADEICGATVNLRGKGDKIGIWTSDATNSHAVLEIGRKIKDRLHIPNNVKLVYQLHDDQMAKNSSATKYSYTI